jgi:menaquinone-specific isochorismate synthase
MLQTYTLAVPNIPLLALWHPTVQPAACYFWGGDATQQPFAAAGAVLQLTASGPQRFADLQQQANALWQTWQDLSPTAHPLSPKLLGGFGFWDQPSTQPQWRAFPAALFIMPQFTLSQVAGRTWLTVARCGESAAEPLAQLAARFLAQLLTVPLPETAAALSPALTVPDCTFDEWAERVAAATTQMQAGTYQKIVLSRTVTAYHQQRLNLATVLAQLPRQYPQCFHFAFTPPSSERLPSTFFCG